MVLAIKLRDDMVINTTSTLEIGTGRGYVKGFEKLKDFFGMNDEESYKEFAQIFRSGKFSFWNVWNLYYLAPIDEMADALLSFKTKSTNYLNFIGFRIKRYPSKKQFQVLNELQSKKLINYYWVEGNTRQRVMATIPPPVEDILPDNQELLDSIPIAGVNEYVKDLGFLKIENRGKNGYLVIFEQKSTDNIKILERKSSFLSHFQEKFSNASRRGGGKNSNEFDEIDHQVHTLITLFGKTSADSNFQFDGIVPDANFEIWSILPAENGDYLGTLRRNLAQMLFGKLRNVVLLFEFETDIFDMIGGKKLIGTFPLHIYKDIEILLGDLVREKNFIILAGAGNIGTDFDNAINPPWQMQNVSYNDLSQNFDSVIMIAGASKKGTKKLQIAKNTNFGKNMDAYIYTDFFVGQNANLGGNTAKSRYEGSSGAVAIAAGIVTFLQANAISEGKTLTNTTIKKVFKKTFMRDYPKFVLTPTTLEELWEVCLEEMKLQETKS